MKLNIISTLVVPPNPGDLSNAKHLIESTKYKVEVKKSEDQEYITCFVYETDNYAANRFNCERRLEKSAAFTNFSFENTSVNVRITCNFSARSVTIRPLNFGVSHVKDDDVADDMVVRIYEFICNTARNQINRVKLHSYLIVTINNSANTVLGSNTAASADGRLKHQYMANANNPTGGNDTNGLTAMLNSLVKLKPEINAGAVQNMMFSPELFKDDGIIVKSVLKSYFQKGGTQAMISVVNKNDLEKAMVEAENYSNLFVRVGGFSARFVTLDRSIQLEILSRTHY